MFKNALRLAKYSAKLIIRNKAFLVIGILIPLLAPFLMNMWYKIPTDEKVERKINRYCEKNGFRYYISKHVNLISPDE